LPPTSSASHLHFVYLPSGHTGLRLLPETYVTLIYSLINHPEEPDAESATEVMITLEEQERDRVAEEEGGQAEGKPTPGQAAGWLMLCK
jgi:hypothetical protein